jgi:deoxyribose-phosphate aldolase
MKKSEMAAMIDHTMLKPEATDEQIIKVCREARENKFASVCINPSYVKLAREQLKSSGVKVCTVIGFPLGANDTRVKAYEAKIAIEYGANEVDMVINVGKLKAKDYEYVKNDIKAVVNEAKGKALAKVIIETCLLTDEEKVKVCKLAMEAGADFVKTSTGFNKGGATFEDVKLMYETVAPKLKVKASGGIRTTEDAIKMIEAGASRIGASASISIINGLDE